MRVFALPGVPVEKVKVTVYPAGKKKALGSTDAQDAQFVLPAGTYDVLVEAGGAEEWLKGVAMVDGNVVSQDVVFDFGTLALTVVQNGATPKVDIVIYPAGQRQTWADYRAENPTSAYSVPENMTSKWRCPISPEARSSRASRSGRARRSRRRSGWTSDQETGDQETGQNGLIGCSQRGCPLIPDS